MSDPKYGSFEYKVKEAKEKLDEILLDAKKLKEERGEIKEVKQIVLPRSVNCTPNQLVEWGNWYHFDKSKIADIERSYKAATSAYESLSASVESEHSANIPNIENNKRIREIVTNFLTAVGISSGYSVSETVGRKRNPQWVRKKAGYLLDLQRDCPITDGYDSAERSLADFKSRADQWYKEMLNNIEAANRQRAIEDRQVRLVAKAMQLAEQHGVKEYKDNNDLIDRVTEIEKNAYLAKELKEGDPIDHSSCDSCSTWYYGEHRCSCGNRRMSLCVEGNILDGFSYYAEAY
jgi:hypothetical protein